METKEIVEGLDNYSELVDDTLENVGEEEEISDQNNESKEVRIEIYFTQFINVVSSLSLSDFISYK